MKPRRNPYPKHHGFGFRYLRAKTALETFGRDRQARPYSRSFDNCFEMYDGTAVVWALMHTAIRNAARGDSFLKRGIENMGANVWRDWLAVYAGADQPELPL